MRSKINNLEELLAEKAKVQAQIDIVERELIFSARRTREGLEVFVDNKFALTKQISQLFQGSGDQTLGRSALGTVGRAVGMGPLWTGILSFLGPVVVNFVQERFANWKERKQSKSQKQTARKLKSTQS